jgi:hypothetical protein
MTSPTPRAVQSSVSGTSDSTSFAVTLPTHAAGDTFVACISADSTPDLSCTGWTRVSVGNVAGSTSRGQVFRRDTVAASSSETNPTFISTTAEQFAAFVYAIPGSALLNVEVSAPSSGADTAANPPNNAPSAGSQDYLWIAYAALDGGGIGVASGPAGYSGFAYTNNGSAQSCTAAVAHKASTASSENPGTFTNTSEQWAGFTIAVYETPASPPPSHGATMMMMGI